MIRLLDYSLVQLHANFRYLYCIGTRNQTMSEYEFFAKVNINLTVTYYLSFKMCSQHQLDGKIVIFFSISFSCYL